MLHFTKMHGTGNDFVVLDGIHQQLDLSTEQIRRLADRHFGIGCDQVLLVERPQDPSRHLFRYRIFNADGGEVEQCGNGARCFAVFVRTQGLTSAHSIPVETLAGSIVLDVLEDGRVRVNMGAPRFAPEAIPFLADALADRYTLATEDPVFPNVEVGAVSMGNPHAVLLVDAIGTAPVDRLGPLLERHPRFTQRANIGFVHRRSESELDLRVYERGVGETLACGTGAAAAMAVLRRRGAVGPETTVHLPGGDLVLSWTGQDDDPVYLTGPAATVFEGTIEP
jgi:diaminopimelate epimerase